MVATQVDTNMGGYASFNSKSLIFKLIITAVDQGNVSMVVDAKQDTRCTNALVSPLARHRSIMSGIPTRTAEDELPVKPATNAMDSINIIAAGICNLKIPFNNT